MISTLRNILVLTALLATSASAQREIREAEPAKQAAVVSFEAIPFFSGDTASTSVNVHYRIPYEFFIILRDPDKSAGGFVGRGELLVELRSEEGNSVAREIRSIVLRQPGEDVSGQRQPDLQGAISFNVKPGTYTVWFSVDDQQSKRSFVSKDQRITTQNPLPESASFSSPIFTKPALGHDPVRYEVLNHGTDAYFGERGGLLFNIRAPLPINDLTVRYTLKHQPDYKGMQLQEFSGAGFVLHPGFCRLVPRSDETFSSRAPVQYVVQQAGDEWRSVFVPLPLEKLQPGTAKLSLEFQSAEFRRTFDRSFRVLWPERPRTLANLDLAVDALKHIASEEELEQFKTYSNTRYVKALFDFWKKMDPDTTTAYNNVMAEYYRRVDVANDRFSSSRSLDGYASDQGRIYILYGSPTNTERLFSPSHPPREVWTYPALKRRFVFEDQARSGVYRLVAAEDL